MRAGTNNSGSDRRQDFVRCIETPASSTLRNQVRARDVVQIDK
jgi:hypothetical protein